ncbi:MAG: endonuclease/exonuclease/phosphatase family protein [Ignavibacteriae bacterium]|nr:endonuclease/exonuclease/phosphatase family protein [Ignavibacteriota bacterium]
MNHGTVSPVIAKGLLALQQRISAANIPPSKIDETLNIATWNIREFGKKPRTEAAIHYIAEILGQFDLIGVVELREDLSDLKKVLNILGPYWRAVYSDAISDFGGNRERVAYIYDKRAATFNGLAAEASPPRKKKGEEYLSKSSFWRAPYIASFRAGSFDFLILTTHIRWGKSNQGRIDELQLLANWIDAKRNEKHAEDKDIIVMGDFNIPAIDDDFYKAITSRGLQMPDALAGEHHGSNLKRDMRYDQILHYPMFKNKFTNAGGVVDYFINDSHIKELFPKGMTRTQFTYQLSDHLPLWMQIDTDIEEMKLTQIIQG